MDTRDPFRSVCKGSLKDNCADIYDVCKLSDEILLAIATYRGIFLCSFIDSVFTIQNHYLKETQIESLSHVRDFTIILASYTKSQLELYDCSTDRILSTLRHPIFTPKNEGRLLPLGNSPSAYTSIL